MKKIRVHEKDLVSLIRGRARLKMDQDHVAVGAKFCDDSIVVTTVSERCARTADRIFQNSIGKATSGFEKTLQFMESYVTADAAKRIAERASKGEEKR